MFQYMPLEQMVFQYPFMERASGIFVSLFSRSGMRLHDRRYNKLMCQISQFFGQAFFYTQSFSSRIAS
jgi:hypothetical protein